MPAKFEKQMALYRKAAIQNENDKEKAVDIMKAAFFSIFGMQHQKATKHTDSLRKSKPAGVLSALPKPAIGEQKQAVLSTDFRQRLRQREAAAKKEAASMDDDDRDDDDRHRAPPGERV